jgi:outer membrane protein assembly factor BamB
MVYLGVDYAGQSRLSRVSLTEPYVPIRWELMARGAIGAAPAIYDNVIYSASGDGNVYAVTDQRLPIWALPGNVFATGGPIVADVRVDDTGVFVAGTDSKLYAIDRVNGRIRWQYFAGTPLTTPPFLTADSVYQFVPGKGVVALDKTTGEFNRAPRWNVESAVEVLGADARHVFLRTADNVILAVDKATGKLAFRTQRTDLAFFAPATSARGETRLFAATVGGQILGIRPITTGGMTGQLVRAPEAPEVTRRLGG